MQHDYEIGRGNTVIGEKTIVIRRTFQSEISKPLKVQAEKGLFFHGGSLQG